MVLIQRINRTGNHAVTDSDEAQSTVSPEKALEDIAVESWRFSRLFLQLFLQLDGDNQSRNQNQLP